MSKKASGLGRGLEALLPKGGGGVVRLPLSAIRPNPHQPRRRFSQEGLEELHMGSRDLSCMPWKEIKGKSGQR